MTKYLFLFLITISEATIGVFVKLVGDDIPIFTLNFYRVFFALLLIVAVMPFIEKKFWKLSKDNIRSVIIIGLLIASQISMFNLAMKMTTIANAVIFWSVAPFFVFIFSTFFLKEKVKKEHILVFVIAFIGLLIAKPLSGGYAVGNTIALSTGAIYAALITYMRYEGKTDEANLVFWYMLIATIILSPALFIFGFGDITKLVYYPSLNLSLPIITWAIFLGVASTGVAYLLINLVLKKINATIYSLVDIIVSPIVAGIFGYFIFKEIPTIHTVVGALFLLMSGFILTAYMTDQDKNFIQKFFDKHIRKIDPNVIEDLSGEKIIK